MRPLKEEEILKPRFVVDENLKLVGCLNNKVGSTTLTLAFLQLQQGHNVDYGHNTIWGKVNNVTPKDKTQLYKYLSEQGTQFFRLVSTETNKIKTRTPLLMTNFS